MRYLLKAALRTVLGVSIFLFVLFIVPSLAHLAVWSQAERPESWRQANWSSAGVLPEKPPVDEAQIYVLSARTGGLKGAFSTHSWLVLKPRGSHLYDRYDVVGWGNPVRKNGYDADANWYSNPPVINHSLTGPDAEALLPLVERAIADYPWQKRGDYTLWPGPNSNTFVASILRQVPALGASTPSTAVGRDFPETGRWFGQHENGDWFATLGGYLGAKVAAWGVELNFLGLVAGFNWQDREVNIPSFGSYRF